MCIKKYLGSYISGTDGRLNLVAFWEDQKKRIFPHQDFFKDRAG